MALVHWMALSLSALVAPRTAPAPEVLWIDLAGVPALAEQAARREAGQILREAGLVLRWRSGRAEDLVAPGQLPVVLLERDRAQSRGGPRVLGACVPSAATPRVWVYLSNLAWTLGLAGYQDPVPMDEGLRLGRAIGRIVAHEVIHAVAPGLRHARSGLMSARFDRRHLQALRLEIDAGTRRGLEAVLAAARAAAALPRS